MGTKITAPRDSVTGLSTGRRQHKPVTLASVTSPRDPASGLPTGKRTEAAAAKDSFAPSAKHAIVSPRDSASGLPTGKRMHKPYTIG